MPAAEPTIKGHRLVRTLGEGGMGRVYLAEDEALGRRAAVKVISERLGADAAARARFLREARAMAAVEHPRVVRVYSYGESEGTAYLVMEYVPGRTLAERVRREGPLPVDEALSLTAQVVEALEAAWEHGLVHRDVKPSNVLLDARGEAHVADFGLAKVVHAEAGDGSLTATGAIVGTPHYVSPEQARGRDVDFRSDVYSLGIVLWEMLGGRPPHRGSTPMEIVAHHLADPLPPIREARPDVPDAVVDLLGAMTAKDPAARPASYGALRTLLDAARGTPTPVPPPRVTTSAPAARRWPRLVAAALAVALVAGGAAWWAVARREPVEQAAARRLAVAVSAFYGPDEESAREGRLMAAMVERAVAQRLAGGATVLGVDVTGAPVRSHEEARALGERLGAGIVVWGSAFALRGETEIQASATLVPRRPAGEKARSGARQRELEALDVARERAGGAVVVGAQAPNQIELRKTGAAGVGDLVLLLAGVHALYAEGKPDEALALFGQAPRTSETLRYRAQALTALGRREQALLALEEATAADPKDAQTWAALGDAHVEAGRFAEAVVAHRRAAEAGTAFTGRSGILFEGKLYARETFRMPSRTSLVWDSGYLLGRDPETGVVRERHRLPGPVRSLRVTAEGLEVTYDEGSADPAAPSPESVPGTVTLSGGRFDPPPSLGTSLLHRRNGVNAGCELAFNFFGTRANAFAFQDNRDDLPRTLPDLEAALRRARERDPTQPWHLFLLGQALAAQGRHREAEEAWKELYAGEQAATPYYEYNFMAASHEALGQPAWADRAFEKALARRRQLSQPTDGVYLIERLINEHWFMVAIDPTASLSPERRHLWLTRAREFGPTPEGDHLAAALWASWFRSQGRAEQAKAEDDFLRKLDETRRPLRHIEEAERLLVLGASAHVAFWVALATVAFGARRRLASGGARSPRPLAWLAQVSRPERRVLAVGLLLGLVTHVAFARHLREFMASAMSPCCATDSPGSAKMVAALEDRLASHPSDAARFAAAVANHLAGRGPRAREIYESLPDDGRAQRNLVALRAGVLVPPQPLTFSDLSAPYRTWTWGERVEALWTTGDPETDPLVLPTLLSLLLGGLGLAALAAVPARPGSATLLDGTGGRGLRLAVRLLPGLASFLRGRPAAGLATLTLSVFVVLAFGALAWAQIGWGHPFAGPLTGLVTPDLQKTFPLPPSLSWWAVFRAQAGATWFWGAVLVSLVSAAALHLRAPGPAGGQASTPGATVALAPSRSEDATPDDRTRTKA